MHRSIPAVSCAVLFSLLPSVAQASLPLNENETTESQSVWTRLTGSQPMWLAAFRNAPFIRFFIEPVLTDAFGFAAPAPPPCAVEPLAELESPEALQLENGWPVDVSGMDPAASRAMARFETLINSAGGAFTVTSAYRPEEYQRHLQEVWDKWILELRDNADPSCQQLRSEAQYEFDRHQLLETQRPVSLSDHTLGFAFDAAIALPAKARFGRRRATVDSLARVAGLMRPAIAKDPVHFRLR